MLVAIATGSCKKDTAEDSLLSSVSGVYKGLLISVTYQTYTGITTIDTLNTELIIQCDYDNNDSLFLTSSEEIFNNRALVEYIITDPGNSHYGDDKSFSKEPTTTDSRIYYLWYNQSAMTDSITINSYLPPSGGWNTQLFFYGTKK